MAEQDPAIRRRFNRNELLRRRGLIKGGPGATRSVPPPVRPVPKARDPRKSSTMRLIEQMEGKPLEELLYEDKIAVLAERWGLDKTTISLWRRRLSTPTMRLAG